VLDASEYAGSDDGLAGLLHPCDATCAPHASNIKATEAIRLRSKQIAPTMLLSSGEFNQSAQPVLDRIVLPLDA
jgi:hypothetical protein